MMPLPAGMARRILMHMGPSVGNYEVLLAGVKENVGFATPEFIDAMKFSLEQIPGVMGADDSYMPFLIPGSGTAAMESVATFLRKGDNVLVLSNGVFGDRWLRILERYPVNVEAITAHAGSTVDEEMLQAVKGKKYRLAVMTHVETSTGVRAPVDRLISTIRDSTEIIAVDGVASVGGERVLASKWDADIVLTASQKAIGAAPGLGILCVRKKLVDSRDQGSLAGYFLDLMNWKPVMSGMMQGAGGYFATPPVSSVFSLKRALESVRKEGIEERVERHRSCSEIFRNAVKGLGLGIVASEGLRSNTVTGVLLESLDPAAFVKMCFDKGVEFATGVHPELRGKYFRVGHMGWVGRNDIAAAVSAIGEALRDSGAH